MNRGQVQQVFLFLMAVIVIIATIYLGGKFIGMFTRTACDAGDAEFMEELDRTLDEYSTYGSRGTATVGTPCDAERLCFIDHTLIGSPESASFQSDDPAMTAAVRSGVETNVFLMREEGTLGVGYDPRIVVQSGVRCVNASRGEFRFRAEGAGRTVTVA